MKKKIVGIFVCMLMIAWVVLPVAGTMDEKKTEKSLQYTDLTTKILPISKMNLPIRRFTSIPALIDDFDPLDEHIIVTVTVNEIRALKTINILSDPNFYLKVTINGNEFVSNVWENMRYLENLNWSASEEIPKNTEFVDVTIALWHKGDGGDVLCDLSPGNGDSTQARTAGLTYSIAAGIWFGDDSLKDPSGYGRLSGIDDDSIYEQDDDCELWFTISQTDFDGDGFPYWLEVNMYNTSPLINNRGEDVDIDKIPIEWEYTFGVTYDEGEGYTKIYDPFKWENHTTLDPEKDGLNNIEEYKTWQWGSDPFRQDIFIELDQMEKGPNGEGSTVPIQAFDILRDTYARQNIVWHIDDGRLGGGEKTIPFRDDMLGPDDANPYYWKYFMHGDAQNWRRGVFRWCVVTYNQINVIVGIAPGCSFGTNINNTYAFDSSCMSTSYHDLRAKIFPIIDGLHRGTFNREMNRASVYAGVIMHETGHLLGLRGDLPGCVWPWQPNYWIYAPYKSCMNYRYVYRGVVDYSDGSRGENDFDDWGTIDLTLFNPHSS